MEQERPVGRITSAEQNFIDKLAQSDGKDIEGALHCLVKEYQDIRKQPNDITQLDLLTAMDERIDRELKRENKSFSVVLDCNDPQIPGGRTEQLQLIVLSAKGDDGDDDDRKNYYRKNFIAGGRYELNYDSGALTKVEASCKLPPDKTDVTVVPSRLAGNIGKSIIEYGSLEYALPQLSELVKSIVSPSLPPKEPLDYNSASAEINDALYMVNTLLKRAHSNYSLTFEYEVPGDINLNTNVHTGDKPFSLNGRFQLIENFPHGAKCEHDVLFDHVAQEVRLSSDLKSKDFHLSKPF